MSEFILMLTHNDRTVANARDLYRGIRGRGLRYVGFKDVGLPFDELAALARELREDGCQTLLEVVSTTREAELASIEAAIALKVDYLLGGRHAHDAVRLLQGTKIQYFPFAGHTRGHPTRLTGDIDGIVDDARALCALDGVHGVDLLAYRFDGDAPALARRVVAAVNKPVIAAGSIDRPSRIAAMRDAGAWGFTVGSALFEGAFAINAFQAQIDAVIALQASAA